MKRNSSWAANQFVKAHFGLTDVETKEFYVFERFSRGAKGLAGAQVSPFRIWLEDWQVEQINEKEESEIPIFYIRLQKMTKR